MADDQNHTDTQQVDPNGDTAHVDWEAKYNEMKQHSREWERKAKANKDAADELAALKEAQMSEQEKLQQQLADAIARADALQAEKLSDKYSTKEQPTVPVVLGDGKHAEIKQTGSAKDDFAQFMKNAFN